MLACMWRELVYLLRHKWDLCLVTLAPLLIIVMFSSMFYAGKPEHLPIAIIDQDHGELSRTITRYISLNQGLEIATITNNPDEVETLLNQTKVWGYIYIPSGAEQRLVNGQDAQISIAYNQSFFSIGNTISSAMLVSTLQGMAEFSGQDYLKNRMPYIDIPTANIKVSPLFNPTLSYELYLEPFMIPAILHLLLCCCVAFAVGQELKYKTVKSWIGQQNVMSALFAKIMLYVMIFCFWTWIWMFWLVEIRGWFVAGSLWLILLAQFLLYTAYAFISSTVVLATKDLAKTFGFIAVYGGSSLSFAGVTLPLNNAPTFTKFWSNIIPFTPYAKLQTEQWVVGSPIWVSIVALLILLAYVVFYFLISSLLLKKYLKGAEI
ncbi:ABC transporter permease [Acinetobacter gerneri]|uniref:ABC transporter permease n=1 Tax=Acinetobacter gerneri TaxID=202952 RepID=A0AAW8JGM3_9GAMM|nr:ABC transporter permease [Acinetobacter gerneri]MDQ9009443.1 ABC transporter permease [Acinetobacter gerneri]MDQ9013548.1 ABC transporter permease [Acinetobacter gerneri]MDQ9024888.1 ABC transporter permease [Acinetobacter gerneri]MDQ9052411.1 ABC transporter permease [Acinetobacter gerneri]MDQ9059864.1 ABC transporter permease [Acinetobacter gerneri]